MLAHGKKAPDLSKMERWVSNSRNTTKRKRAPLLNKRGEEQKEARLP